VITNIQENRDLPFLRTVICVWCTFGLASFLTSFLFVGRVYYYAYNASPVMVAADVLLVAAIGAVILEYLLRGAVDYEIPYGARFLALVAGSVASTVLGLVFLYGLEGGASIALRPFAAITFLPSLVGAVVSWWVLQNAVGSAAPPTLVEPQSTDVRLRAAPQQTRIFDDPHAGDPTASAYQETILAVRESALGLVGAVNNVHPDSVPTVIADGLIPYEAAVKRLEQAQLPSAVAAELNQRLVAGLKQLAEDLTATADEAAMTAASRLYQRGLITPSMADVSDGGARYRWDLEQSNGLKAVKQALADLKALGFGGL